MAILFPVKREMAILFFAKRDLDPPFTTLIPGAAAENEKRDEQKRNGNASKIK